MASKSMPTQPRISAKDSQFATLIVGPNSDKFTAHLDLLVHHSSYFRAALTGSFKEAESKTITLADENPTIVEFFIHWLYHQRLPNEKDSAMLWALWSSSSDDDDDDDGDDDDDDDENEDEDDGQVTTENLINTYIFGDKCCVRTLCNEVITELYLHIETEFGSSLPGTSLIRHAFTNLDEDAPLLGYIVDAYCYFARGDMWDDFGEVDWHYPFISRVLARYTDCKGDHTPGPCHCHVHKSREEVAECRADLSRA